MAIESYILNDESVLSDTFTPFWTWICTDKRLIKYRNGSGTKEQFHDVSFEEISAISFVNTGRDEDLQTYGILSGVFSLLIFLVGAEIQEDILFLGGLVALTFAIYFLYEWYHSEESYFEFRGNGLVSKEEEMWRIKGLSDENTAETQDFVKTVRSQLE